LGITELLTFAMQNNASDLHLSADTQPIIRVDGDLRKLELPPLASKQIKDLLLGIMNEKQQQDYARKYEIDFALVVPGLGRFRVNVFTQNRGMSAVFRTIPEKIVSLEELAAPNIFKDIANYPRGLVLVTGPTGSGKSTTLAAMINYLNATKPYHILTVEDPIEFVHISNRSLISQREVERDTLSFNAALRSAMREDPDVILVGELRDLETIRLALTAAETGHLVFATLHTSSATKSIDRIIDVFPGDEKAMVRTMLSESLRAVISQVLLKKASGSGRLAAYEIMLVNPAIKNLIREAKVAQMYSVMQTSKSEGMQTLDQYLQELLRANKILQDTAQENKDSAL
jgi:twitching motility protein PilT